MLQEQIPASIFLTRKGPSSANKAQPWKTWHQFVEATEEGSELVISKNAADGDANLGGY